MAKHKLHSLVWLLLVSGVVLLAVKTFVGDVYRVSSSSMEPLYHKDEYVFVLHDRSPPQRFEPIVARVGADFLVKRAVGIGGALGEDVLLDGGDLKVDGQPLGDDAPHPPYVPLFDDALQSIEDDFVHGDAWHARPDGVLELDARDVPYGANAGLLRYHRQITDGYLQRDGQVVDGVSYVPDAAVEVEFVVPSEGGRVRVTLLEGSEAYEFSVDLSQAGMAAAKLTAEGPGIDAPNGREVLGETVVPLEWNAPIRMRFSNRDDQLAVEWSLSGWDDAPPVLQVHHRTAPTPKDARVLAFERVTFGGEGCRLELRHLRVLRDQFWTPQGDYGVGRKLVLQPGEVYLLGDNSASSHDSRHFGAVEADQVVGRPLLVVWPLSNARRVR